MFRFTSGLLISLGLALWLEAFYKFGATFNPVGFFISIPFYIVIICALHGVFSMTDRLWGHTFFSFVLGGFVGLMVEWYLVGNSPWNNPNALQWGQFVFHAVYPILGYLIVHTEMSQTLQRALIFYFVGGTLVTMLGFVWTHPLQKLWFLFLPLFVCCGFVVFIFRLGYIRKHD